MALYSPTQDYIPWTTGLPSGPGLGGMFPTDPFAPGPGLGGTMPNPDDPNQPGPWVIPPIILPPGIGGLGGGGGRTLPPLQQPVPPPPDTTGIGGLGGGPGRQLPPLSSQVQRPSTISQITSMLTNLGKIVGQQQAAKGGGGRGEGGSREAGRGGGGQVPMMPALPLVTAPYGGLPPPQGLVPIRGSFQQGGTAPESGVYQVEQGETVRTPDQEQALRQLLASNFGINLGLPGQTQPTGGIVYDPGMSDPSIQHPPNRSMFDIPLGQLPGGQRAAQAEQQTQQQAGQQAQVMPQAGQVSAGGGGPIPSMGGPPQFGDPNAFPRIPGIPETGVSPEQAAGPGRYPPIQQLPMPGSFLDKGARTAWMVRDVLNNVSQGAARYQQMKWDRTVGESQAEAMKHIQQQMQQQGKPGGAPGQPAAPQPDEATQALQAALQQERDPKERQKLQRMLEQRTKAQEREQTRWAKILTRAQDPTTPEYIGVQRAYATMEAMGQQQLKDAMDKEGALSKYWNSMAQLMNAQAKVNAAKNSQMIAGNMADEWDALNGNAPGTSRGQMQQAQPGGAPVAPGQPPAAAQPGAAPSTAPGAPAAGAKPTAPTTALGTFIATYGPPKGGQKALMIGAIRESVETGKTKPFYDALKTIWSDNEKNLKVDSKLSEVIYDPESPTKFSMWARNHQGEDIIDPKTGQQMLLPGVPRPAGAETASITQMKWTDSAGNLHLRPITSLRNVPVNPQTGTHSSGHIPTNPLPPPGGTAPAGPGHTGVTHVPTQPKGSPMTSPGTGGITGGDIIIGTTKVPKLMGATLPGGEQWAGTPADAAAIGLDPSQLHELAAPQLNIIQSAREITAPEGLIKEVEDDLKAFKPGELNWMNSRWQEFLNQGIGQYSDSRYNRLRVQLNGLLGTAVMQSHGVGRGIGIMEHFDNLAKAGTMSAQTISDAIEAERDYIEGRAERPRVSFTLTQDGRTRHFQVPSDQAVQFRRHYPKATAPSY